LSLLITNSSLSYLAQKQEAMEKVDAAYLEEIVKSGTSASGDGSEKKKTAYDVKFDDISTTIDDILEEASRLGKGHMKAPKTDAEKAKDKGRKFPSDCQVVFHYLKLLLKLWGQKLNDREDEEKRSQRGKMANAIYGQTQAYLKPLLKQLEKESIADDILWHMVNIIRLMLDREYVKANDAYLQMAIGNAPWPIGVTMVGIHARTGREKIFAQNIAHVLNDETQRKYIQALKRLMTQCQRLFPTDPSKCVEYTKE